MDYDKRLQLILITFGAALLASACTTSVERHYSKEEALERDGWSEQGTDLCDLEGWYDDGECDGFCPEPDGDCDATCLAYPSCGPDEVEHASASECPADASCHEVSLCGSTIWCSSDDTPVCAGPNPAGCVSTGCEAGFVCDTTAGTAPSACGCDPESGTWTCTADVSGGACVPAT